MELFLNMKKHLTKAILILSISPIAVFATAGVTDFSGLGKFINDIKDNVITNLSALFLTTAVVAFFYGVVNYMISIRNGETKGVTDGKNFMLWGLIALFVMFSVWGIVTFAQRTLGIQGQTTIDIPSIRFGNTGAMPGSANTSPASGMFGGNNNWTTNYGQVSAGNTAGVSAQSSLLANNQECSGDSQCQSGNCVLSSVTGVKRCQSNSIDPEAYCLNNGGIWYNNKGNYQCDTPDQYCVNNGGTWTNNQCNAGAPLKPKGSACFSGSECQSGSCSDTCL